MNDKVKIVAIADVHGNNVSEMIPPCDILLICGDISPIDMSHGSKAQRKWFKNTFIDHLHDYRKKANHVLFVAGNHDRWLYKQHLAGLNGAVQDLLPDDVYYLCNDTINIMGILVHGNPWVSAPQWADVGGDVWNFASRNSDFLGAIYDDIPNDVDIIMSHGPAYGYCDQILDNGIVNLAAEAYGDSLKAEHLGDHTLSRRIKNISDARPDKQLWIINGHIHSASHIPQSYVPEIGAKGARFVCASVLNEQYRLGDYKPFELDWK